MVVPNRKNSLFVGNARGGRTAAIQASLTSTCQTRSRSHADASFISRVVYSAAGQFQPWFAVRWPAGGKDAARSTGD